MWVLAKSPDELSDKPVTRFVRALFLTYRAQHFPDKRCKTTAQLWETSPVFVFDGSRNSSIGVRRKAADEKISAF